ncbi:ZIP family metal transporter [Microcella frigidaquae]|jgi:ZIP family zinc transporter|uniref:ZIP family zinc transporter n=1 Tax=Microcella frigidaquae TaxID=424758 RepID=A0A840X8P8_9MICO|nr:ZIP family zinc transporter [Microcella frigidaquae]MBB5618740.1 ZIP family zinc transporter [Microcella frigidaquae]NHN44171.1 ZIP family zinc transporter [Microcella frigidaquae]
MLETLAAGAVGLGAASFLLIGAAIGWLMQVPTGVVAGVMAFGAGALISTLAYELVGEAHAVGGLAPTIGGFLAGAVIYVLADLALARQGARARKRSIALQSAPGVHAAPVVPAASAGVGLAVAIGALLDGVPESLVLGLSIADGGAVSIPMLVAVAVSNVPEGLSSAAGMKHEGRSARYVFGVWGGIMLVSGVAAMLGFALLSGASPEVVAVVTTIAAGGIMAMVANTMIPEAFAADRSLTGLWAALGFALAFALYQLG